MSMSYTKEEAVAASTEYFGGDELAAKVWVDKYALKDGDKILELTPTDMHRRLAKEIARIESKYPNPMPEEVVFHYLEKFNMIVPQGGNMYGIGNDYSLSSLSNCFVVGNKSDSYGGIMQTDQELVQLMKRRGGVGTDLSHLRPSGEAVSNAAGSSSGVTSFAERYSNSTREVAQDGRRGALMLSIESSHPDCESFIDMKMDGSKVTGANVSIKADDEFMLCAEKNMPYTQRWGDRTQITDAKRLFDKLVFNAWKSAEPGLLFWDAILNESPARGYGDEWKETSTNPCGEIPLCPYDSCRLLAVNLMSCVENPFSYDAKINVGMIDHLAAVAVRIMDDIVDLEIEKIDKIISKIKSDVDDADVKKVELDLWYKIRSKAVNGRRIGVGHTGLGDMLAALNLKYGTTAATNFCSELQQLFATSAYIASIELAKDRGAFPVWSLESDFESEFIVRMFSSENTLMSLSFYDDYVKYGRRNLGVLTLAPTGTTSMMTQTTAGVEPLFTPRYFRRRKTNDPSKSVFTDAVGDMWEETPVIHKWFVYWYSTEYGVDFESAMEVLKDMDDEQFTAVFGKSPYYKATAQDVDYIEKVRLQGKIQKWVDHSISVTVNMPESATVDMVRDVYVEAWKSGCKGITVYREGSRGGVLLTKQTVGQAESFDYISAHKRPKEVDCDVYFRKVQGAEFAILVGIVDDKPYEIFAIPLVNGLSFPKGIMSGKIIKKKSRHYTFESEVFCIDNIVDYLTETEQNQTRDYSLMLRHRVDPKYICDSIESYATISSFQKAILRIVKLYIESPSVEKCTECGADLVETEGCKKCLSCGYSKCG